MPNITLQVQHGEPETLPMEMPAATTGKYAFARVVEALGGDPREVRGFLVCLDPSHHQQYIGADKVVADHDGHTVITVTG